MLNYLMLKLVRSFAWRFLMIRIVPYIRFTTYYTSFRGDKYHRLYEKLQPGHIILAVDKRKLTTLIIPGTMTHAALCVAKRPKGRFEVAEMTHTNYTRSDFFDICKEADRVVVLQNNGWVASYLEEVLRSCHSFKDAKYDVAFNLGVKELYCSELVYQSDVKAARRLGAEPRLLVDLSDIHGLKRPYISPDGILFGRSVRCVVDSDGEWDHLTGPEMRMLVEGAK